MSRDFHFSKTPELSKTALVFSPWQLRPGQDVTVTYRHVQLETVDWYSDEEATFMVDGTPYPASIKGDWPIPEENITIVDGTITLAPINHGPIQVKIYYQQETTVTVTARGAIEENDATYYNDWFLDERGIVVPYTVVELTTIASEKPFALEDFDVSFDAVQRGVSVLEGEVWRSSEHGILTMVDPTDNFSVSRNLYRKGLTEVEVPLTCTIEKVRDVLENSAIVAKRVEIDLQEKADDAPNEFRGILWMRDFLYVLSEKGMARFWRWGEFSVPDKEWPEILGNDLTYALNDLLLVTKDNAIRVYRVIHDWIHVDRGMQTLTTREEFPEMEIQDE